MWQNNQREGTLAVGNGQVGGNGTAIPGGVGDVFHICQLLGIEIWLVTANDLYLALVDQVVGARVTRAEVAHRHGVAAAGAAGDGDVVGVGDDRLQLLHQRAFRGIKPLYMDFVLGVDHANRLIRVAPAIAVVANTGDVYVIAPIHQLSKLLLFGIEGPQANLVITVVGADEKVAGFVGIRSVECVVLFRLFAPAIHFGPVA